MNRQDKEAINPIMDMILQAFTRPQKQAETEDDRKALAQARPISIPYAGQELLAWSWGQGPQVLLLHGWESRASHMASFVAPLLQAGFSVTALDAPAHGASQGESTNVLAYGKAVVAVAQHLGALTATIAHSVGSAASLYAFAQGVQVQASVHLCGPASLTRVLQQAARLGGLDETERRELEQMLVTSIGAPLETMDLDQLQHGMRHPALIMHDPEDKEMPYAESQALAAAWPQAKLIASAGTGHRRILRTPDAIHAAVSFIVESSAIVRQLHC
ncbi:alpha/beta fold hydrolase [Undibacterium umbellatum]|uniref:Alpha/beta hydrolase n=1 Tax=Undibacterium umbellatum TaxID=2762300 RepID=A0ABR6ZA06_9BURK|nr:alpha/beta fold hydrolase [Undibacterium umbellatum]MBC3908424.1 alpha/beta hydrolase [Undibacterium umbellatum]